MTSILDDLKADIDAALDGELRSATYWRSEQTGTDPFGHPIMEWQSYPCQGVRGTFDALLTGTGTIPVDNARIELLASSLSVEVEAGDIINIDSTWWSVSRIERDPASAWWTLQCGTTSEVTP